MQTRTNHHRLRPSGRELGASIGGILAVIALIAVVVVGYLLIRDGATNEVQEQTQEQTTELQEGFDAAEARTRLSALKSSIEADVEEEALREQYDDIRADLEAGYASAEGEAAETWDNIQPRLDELGEQIGQASEDAVATIDDMLAEFPEGN